MAKAEPTMQMSQKGLWWEHLKVTLPIVLILAVVAFIAWQFVEPAPPQHVRFATGSAGGAYESLGQRYAADFARNGISLEPVASAGSVENWQLLLSEEVDAAIVQGGTAPTGAGDTLQAVASVAYEPLFVFYRTDSLSLPATPELTQAERLQQLDGLKVATGGEGSGTRLLVETLLAEAGMPESLKIEQVAVGGRAAADALLQGEIDAAAFVMSPSAPMIQELLSAPELSLIDFALAQALSYRLPYLTPVTLYQGVIDPAQDLPPRDIRMVAPASYLVVRRDTHRSVVQLLMEAAKSDQGQSNLITRPGVFPSLLYTDIPVAAEAEYFFERGPNILHRHLPFWLASMVDRLVILIIPLLVILIPLLRIAPPALRWNIRRRIYRWYSKLKIMDATLARNDVPLELLQSDLRLIRTLEDEVGKTEVPLSYMEEFYNLRLHVSYIRRRLEERISEADQAAELPEEKSA
ncbi:TAXI family TRAP transporter solute-binding subunit [Nitrincola alkalilacustris]|uniref:TAXI family TRAP transporter solute-binding subunit n=1 Tax=Nitrincola alkalilacustris TaxID=1571224 RepID=UPI00124D8308|nr:TAXI family TRAP transporter solute-binding subunit [Nitrincola alkalilacustris]